MAEFKTKEEYEKWKAEKANQIEEKIKLKADNKNNPALPKSIADNDQVDDRNKPRENTAQTKKKSIAKGGLIILLSLFIGAALMIVSNISREHEKDYLSSAQDVFFRVDNEKNGGLGEYKKVKFPYEVNEQIIEHSLRRDFKGFVLITYSSNEVYGTSAYYDKSGNTLWFYGGILGFAANFFLIFFPPLYLLFKFVTWAIRTLREKPTGEVR